jgi:catechol 2,3-dioxygenase-like lactoylglutathione lyase family enzyme
VSWRPIKLYGTLNLNKIIHKAGRFSVFKNTKAFSSFSVSDLQKAKEFYGDTLGLEFSETPEGLELHVAGGSTIFVYPKPDHVPATFTVLNFPVDNVERAVHELTEHGVRFEKYNEGD